jgi:hypothetical protein
VIFWWNFLRVSFFFGNKGPYETLYRAFKSFLSFFGQAFRGTFFLLSCDFKLFYQEAFKAVLNRITNWRVSLASM